MFGLDNWFISGLIRFECDYYIYLDALNDLSYVVGRNGTVSVPTGVKILGAFDVLYDLRGAFLSRVLVEIKIRRLIKKLNKQGVKVRQLWSV